MKKSWDVQVITDSGVYKKVRVDDYYTENDAKAAALGQTGAKQVAYCLPATNYGNNYWDYKDKKSPESYVKEQVSYDDIDEKYSELDELDEMEEEMYDLMCRIAMEKGEELPTIQEFYDYIGKE